MFLWTFWNEQIQWLYVCYDSLLVSFANYIHTVGRWFSSKYRCPTWNMLLMSSDKPIQCPRMPWTWALDKHTHAWSCKMENPRTCLRFKSHHSSENNTHHFSIFREGNSNVLQVVHNRCIDFKINRVLIESLLPSHYKFAWCATTVINVFWIGDYFNTICRMAKACFSPFTVRDPGLWRCWFCSYAL